MVADLIPENAATLKGVENPGRTGRFLILRRGDDWVKASASTSEKNWLSKGSRRGRKEACDVDYRL